MKDVTMKEVSTFLDEVKKIAKDYYEFMKDKKTLGFNIFALTSERYYLENYHSDILKAFLDPNENHGEKSLFLEQFLNLFNVKFESYANVSVTREKNNIDILIKNESSNQAIIIENKINNAPDTYNQIPRYYETISKSYKVYKIIYIPLDKDKRPDKSTWNTLNQADIENCLEILPAFSKGETSLKDWIENCILLSNNIDNISILRQYLKLIEFLTGGKSMSDKLIEDFYKIVDGDKLKTAIGISNMLKKIPEHIESKVRNKYSQDNNKDPFKNIETWDSHNGTILSGYELDNRKYKLEIYCKINEYEIIFKEDGCNDLCNIKDTFKDVTFLNDFEDCGSKCVMKIRNEDDKKLSEFEKKLFTLIDNLLGELKNIQSTPSIS